MLAFFCSWVWGVLLHMFLRTFLPNSKYVFCKHPKLFTDQSCSATLKLYISNCPPSCLAVKYHLFFGQMIDFCRIPLWYSRTIVTEQRWGEQSYTFGVVLLGFIVCWNAGKVHCNTKCLPVYLKRKSQRPVGRYSYSSPWMIFLNQLQVCSFISSTGLILWIEHRKKVRKLTFQALALRQANARNVSFRISFRWPIHNNNPVDKTKLS